MNLKYCMNKRILSLFDYSGVMVEPWLKAGHEVTIVDLQHPAGINVGSDGIIRVGCDVTEFKPDGEYDIVFAFPPCTHLAGSGARWWSKKGVSALIDGLSLVSEAGRVIIQSKAPVWMIENPVGRLSTLWMKPDYIFDPCDYGGYISPTTDQYIKRTCLWTSVTFVMPEPKRVPPVLGSIVRDKLSSRDKYKRSLTPKGFAEAIYVANH